MKINPLLDLADSLDEKGLFKEASVIDTFIKTAKTPMHKCGLKQETVEAHEQLLEDYKSALEHHDREYQKAIRSNNDSCSPNMGNLREAMRGKVYNCNAVCLHEMYFEDVINSKPFSLEKAKVAEEILHDLYEGGSSQFLKEIKKVAMTPRCGWVILNFCLKEKKLFLDICDLHEIGVAVNSAPVLALDLWEHAYINDFGLDKEAYVNWYLSHLDWRNFAKRVRNLLRIK